MKIREHAPHERRETDGEMVWEFDPDGSVVLHLPPYSVRFTVREIEQIARYWEEWRRKGSEK